MNTPVRRTYWESEDFDQPYQMGPQQHRLYILNKLKELGVVKLLDVGCGTGPIYDLICNPPSEGQWDNIQKYKGTDYSWQMIKTAKRMFPYGNFEVQDARNMLEPDKSWDCVLLMHILDHVNDYQAVIKEAVRVSKKYIALILWRGFVDAGTHLNDRNMMGKREGEKPWEDTFLQEYSRKTLITEFNKYNLLDVDIADGDEVNSDYSKYNYVWILKKI